MNRKIKYLVIFVFLMFGIFLFTNQGIVQAKDLEFVASKCEGGVIIRTFSVASYRTINAFFAEEKNLGEFVIGDIRNEYGEMGYKLNGVLYKQLQVEDSTYTGTSFNYSSAGIQFQEKRKGYYNL